MTDTPVGTAGLPEDGTLQHWRLLVAVVAPVVAVATLVQSMLDVLSSGGNSAVVDGLTLRTPGWPDALAGLVWLVAWAWAVSAVMIALRGLVTGEPPSAFEALRQAARRLPTFLGVLVIGGIGATACLLLAGVVGSFAGPLVFVVVAVAVFAAASLVGTLPVAALDGLGIWASVSRGVAYAEGRRWRVFLVMLGVVVAGVPAGWLSSSLPDVTAGPITAALGRLAVAALTVGAIGVQGALLARWRLGLDGGLSRATAPCPGHWLAACGGLTAVVVVTGGLVLVNPMGVPVLSSSGPLKSTEHLGEYAVTTDGEPRLGVGASKSPIAWDTKRALFDGGTSLVALAYPGNGPVEMTTCQGTLCTMGKAELERPGFFWDHWVARALPGGGLLAVAPVIELGTVEGTAKLVAWICPDRTCRSSHRIELAEVSYEPPQDFPLAVAIGPEGAPMIAYAHQDGRGFEVVRCADRDCTRHTQEYGEAGTLGGEEDLTIVGLGFDRDGRPVAVLAGKTPPTPSGLHVRMGREPRPRVISVTCEDDSCSRRTTRAWNEISDDGGDLRAWPVSMPDGHLAILQEDVRGARLITCRHHCEG
ncbi:MAG: hypothetical protein HOU81_22145 [Hamadaea sp.]|uniref:hypothetical protein n=1 Tax=Hamadaea sp. TaxID=2024425 RepID=UPI001853FCDB|nr:hypothetical protein [Hamadaea sp.]NUR73530.1 hypothetical protein [Hamadaea sp.]NUT19767.1 hypothetical protein [Hamadaea sp.]